MLSGSIYLEFIIVANLDLSSSLYQLATAYCYMLTVLSFLTLEIPSLFKQTVTLL